MLRVPASMATAPMESISSRWKSRPLVSRSSTTRRARFNAVLSMGCGADKASRRSTLFCDSTAGRDRWNRLRRFTIDISRRDWTADAGPGERIRGESGGPGGSRYQVPDDWKTANDHVPDADVAAFAPAGCTDRPLHRHPHPVHQLPPAVSIAPDGAGYPFR